MALGKQEPELGRRGLKILAAVGKAAAADHEIAEAGKVRLAHMLVALAHLHHGHAGQGQHAVDDGLQRRGHAVAIEGEAEHQQIALEDLLQDGLHIVPVDAGPAVVHAGKAAGAGFDMLIHGVEKPHLLFSRLPHPLQKGPGDAESVALLPLGTAVQNQDPHAFSSFRAASPFSRMGRAALPCSRPPRIRSFLSAP